LGQPLGVSHFLGISHGINGTDRFHIPLGRQVIGPWGKLGPQKIRLKP